MEGTNVGDNIKKKKIKLLWIYKTKISIIAVKLFLMTSGSMSLSEPMSAVLLVHRKQRAAQENNQRHFIKSVSQHSK